MILDNISHSSLYKGISKGIDEALDFIQNNDMNSLSEGRHNLGSNSMFVIVSSYNTKPVDKGVWEAHRKYIDLQYIISGAEMIGHTSIAGLTTAITYDPDNDIEFLIGKEGSLCHLKSGDFAIFYPHDAHMPGLKISNSQQVYKAVFKIIL